MAPVLIVIGAACDEGGATAPEIPGARLTVSGTVTNATGDAIPAGAHVPVA
ncbi:MAG: hypothetical protein ACREK5_08965 [Gemmatimonadota bacterium]